MRGKYVGIELGSNVGMNVGSKVAELLLRAALPTYLLPTCSLPAHYLLPTYVLPTHYLLTTHSLPATRLVEQGCEPDLPTHDGTTPLHWAVWQGAAG